jgi:hypothetical protein
MSPKKKCPYCGRTFLPSRYHPNQSVCTSSDCRRKQRSDYHRRKVEEDPSYREQCRLSQQKWREANPNYMKQYLLKRRRIKRSLTERSPIVTELQQLLDLAKKGRVLELKAFDAAIVLVRPKRPASKKNTSVFQKKALARAKIVVLEGLLRAFLAK